MYVPTYVCMYECTCTYVCMYVCVCMYVRTCVCAYVSLYVCMYECMYVRMCVCTYLSMYVCDILSNLKYSTPYYETRYKSVAFGSNIVQLILATQQTRKLVTSRRQ
jgi:hypothetical protein